MVYTGTMEFDPEQRRRALLAFMELKGLKATPWEVASDLGEGTLRKFLDRTSDTLTDRTYVRLAAGASKLLGEPVSLSALQGKSEGNITESVELSPEPNVVSQERQKIVAAPSTPSRDEMNRDIPVLGTTLAGKEGDFQLTNGDPIDHVLRPPHMSRRKGLFALYVNGTSMVPWRKPGQLVFIDGRAPHIGDHVVIELRPIGPDDDRPTFLKLLMGISPSKIKLAQYKPAKEFEIDRRRVLKIWRCIEADELLGF